MDRNRWHAAPFKWQMGNIASELSRAVQFEKAGDSSHRQASLTRAIALLVATVDDIKNRSKAKELCRFKEVVADWYAGENRYSIRREALRDYALFFTIH